jgi:hypothetical protein
LQIRSVELHLMDHACGSFIVGQRCDFLFDRFGIA